MSLLVFLALTLLLLPGAGAVSTNDTSQAYGGSGINFLLTGDLADKAFDCDPAEDASCYALNAAACKSSAQSIDLTANFVSSVITCDDSSQRKIWLSSDASCQDTSSTEYITTSHTLNESDTASGIYLLCGSTIDYYPNSNLKEEAFTSRVLFEKAGENDSCSAGIDQILYLCYAIGPVAGGSTSTNTVFGWHKFKIDTKAPSAPQVSVKEGDSKVTIEYSTADSDIALATVYYREAADSNSDNCLNWDNPKSATNKSDSQSASITVNGIENGKKYQYCLIMTDDLGNMSEPSAVGTFSSVDECDFWECAPEDLGKGGFCFVATAAYGPGDPVLEVLRRFRDTVLMESNPGRFFIHTYYRLSPPIAAVIAQSPWLRALTRVLLTPLEWTARSIMAVKGHKAGFSLALAALAIFVGAMLTLLLSSKRRSLYEK